MPGLPARALLVTAALVAAAVPAASTAAPSGSSTVAVAASAPSALPCPTGYADPDPDRPVLDATVVLDGRGGATVTQTLQFRPDLPTGEVVLRLWAAAPRPAARGGAVEVRRVAVNGVERRTTRPTPTLLRVPLAGRARTDRAMTITVQVALRLPTGADDRLGHRNGTSWLGSALPMLAWERGRGWATEPATSQFAEAATSEAYRLASLRVTRPAGHAVLATGERVSDDGRTAVFRARSVRDLLLASGPFRVARTTVAAPQRVEVEVGVTPGLRDDPAAVAGVLAAAARAHAARFGPYPYERLVAAVVPDLGGGVEQPGAILLGSGQTADSTASHEVAHMWFYGLVGDDQARDPWLDEAFATYAEALHRGTGAGYERTVVPADGRGRVGAPMTYWEGRSSYYRSVYVQGAAALLRARRAVGAAAFDRALGCHVRRQAQQVTTPADVEASFRHLPAALAELRRAGALPR